MSAIRAEPAIAVDYAPVYLRVDFALPATDTLITVMDNQVYVLAVFSAVHMQAAPWPIEVLRM